MARTGRNGRKQVSIGAGGSQWAPATLRGGADDLTCLGSSDRALSRTLWVQTRSRQARTHFHGAPILHRRARTRSRSTRTRFASINEVNSGIGHVHTNQQQH
jgi:hypothetical protein